MGNALAAKPMFRAAKDGDVGQLERLLYIPGTDVNDHDNGERNREHSCGGCAAVPHQGLPGHRSSPRQVGIRAT